MKRHIFLILAAFVALSVFAQQEQPELPPYSVFVMPTRFPGHLQLAESFKKELAAGNFRNMEEICAVAVKLFPEDPTWHYNLACSLARNAKHPAALDALEKAVEFGFTDADKIREDSDLATVRRDPRFAAILDKAKFYTVHPEKRAHLVKASKVGKTAVVSTSNTIWNMEGGGFLTLFEFPDYKPSGTNKFVKAPGKTGEKIREWQLEGTAAGNYGDLYNNLDAGHSTMDLKFFPEMTAVKYCPAAISNRIEATGATMLNFGGVPVIGNCSMAMTEGPDWRSIARYAQGFTVQYLLSQYLGNAIYVYPQHHDYLPTVADDVFPSRTPYLLIAPGSSWTDKPILAAMASALAAMKPETKKEIVRRHLLAPVMQYLLHASLNVVEKREDYLKPQAHPLILNGARLDTLKLVELAHALETNALPPLVAFRVTRESGARARPFIDFFDLAGGERLFETPFAVARVFRNMNYSRQYTFEAAPVSADPSRKITYHWILVQGDPEHVRIKTRGEDNRIADVEIDYQGPLFDTPFGVPSSRVDIALVGDDGRHYSPAAFFSCFFLRNEKRVYSEQKRIISVDYASESDAYVEPEVSLRKNWKDLYVFDSLGRISGWTRFRDGEVPVSYTSNGERVTKADPSGNPIKSIKVKYGREEIETPNGISYALREE